MAAETLRQAVSAAIERFPEIQAAQHRREAARAQVGQARAEFFPSVSGSVGEGRETSRNVSTRALGEDVTLRRREGEISVTQLVFDGGAAGGQVRRFAARAEGADFTLIGRTEEVALRAGQAFIEVRRLREQLQVARENIGVHEKTLSDVNAIAEAGRGRRADVTQAQARRALAASSADQLSGQLAQAEAGFRHFIGRPPGELAAPPSLDPELPPRVERAISDALAAHPAVRAAEKEVEAAQHDRESARARLAVPRVTIEAGASRQPGSPMIEIVPQEDSLLVETRLRPADIAFVRVGQRAIVKVTAYDYSIFGGLEGKIEHVSADSTVPQQGEPFYVAHVRTASNGIDYYGKKLSISPGMLASVDVITGKRSVLYYLAKPINRARQRALTER